MGESDYDWQVIEIIGPMDWDEMVHGNGDEDQRLDHFETPHTTLIGEANRTVRAWSTDKPLMPGKYMIDGCFILTDQDPSNTCHSVGMLRFEVFEEREPLLGSFWAMVIVPMSIVLWIIFSIREATLPLLSYAVILMLALSVLGPAASLPDIDSKANEGGEPLHPSFYFLTILIWEQYHWTIYWMVRMQSWWGYFSQDLLMQNIREMILNLLTS